MVAGFGARAAVRLFALSHVVVLLAGCQAESLDQGAPQLARRGVLPLGVEGADALAWSPDGRTLAVGVRDSIVLWEVASQKVRGTIGPHETDVSSLVFTKDGKALVAVSGPDSTIIFWDLATGKKKIELTGRAEQWAVELSPDGMTLVSGAIDGSVKLWDVSSGEELASLPAEKDILLPAFAISRDGKTLAVGSGKASAPTWGKVKLWDLHGENRLRTIDLNSVVSCLAFSPGGELLVTGDNQETLRLWNPATGKEARNWDSGFGGTIKTVTFLGKGDLLIGGGSQPKPNDPFSDLGELRLWDVATGRLIATFKTKGPIDHAALSPDGKTLADAGNSAFVELWDVGVLKGADR